MFSSSPSYVLTEEQRRMYASEEITNFRWISKMFATYSPHTLTDEDLAPENLYKELAEFGQFAELSYSTTSVPIEFLLENFSTLSQPRYPLEHYNALSHIALIDSFRGSFADLPAIVVYRPPTGQLIVSISGTSKLKHILQDLRVLRSPHPSGRGSVHTGFWELYQGLKTQLLTAIRKGIVDHSPGELVLTGHSMGGCLCYLLCIDLLRNNGCLPRHLPLQVAVFGCPRTGDSDLVTYFHELVSSFREREGEDYFKEYSVKGYNDGVPTLPPTHFGYRHFCQEPIYTVGGKLYRTPSTESEHALFRVESDSKSMSEFLFPKGGHNYYNRRDHEDFARRMSWLERAVPHEDGWEGRYEEIMLRWSLRNSSI